LAIGTLVVGLIAAIGACVSAWVDYQEHRSPQTADASGHQAPSNEGIATCDCSSIHEVDAVDLNIQVHVVGQEEPMAQPEVPKAIPVEVRPAVIPPTVRSREVRRAFPVAERVWD
jgi:hypothetical protein